MSKPKIAAYVCNDLDGRVCLDSPEGTDFEWLRPGEFLIRLTEHEEIVRKVELEVNQADYNYDCWKSEHEADRAADKARIAELEAALRNISAEVDGNIRECVRDCVNQRGNVQDIYEYCDRIDSTVGAALSQQGKEGET